MYDLQKELEKRLKALKQGGGRVKSAARPSNSSIELSLKRAGILNSKGAMIKKVAS